MALGTDNSTLFERMDAEGNLVEGKDGYVGIGEDHVAIFTSDGLEIVYWHDDEFQHSDNTSAAPAAIKAIMTTMQEGASEVRDYLYE